MSEPLGREERDALCRWVNNPAGWPLERHGMHSAYVALADQVDAALAALRRYGQHDTGCPWGEALAHRGLSCTCGFADALAAAPAPEEGS